MANKTQLRERYGLTASQIAAIGPPHRIVRQDGIAHYYRLDHVSSVLGIVLNEVST